MGRGGLYLHRAERADRLAGALAGVLARTPGDPFTPDVIAVPSRGIERWLAQELSLRIGTGGSAGDGVCANVEFPFPAAVVARALAAAGGTDPEADPWAPGRLVWPLLEVVDRSLDEDWLGTLRAHLGGAAEQADPTRRARRFSAVRHVADLFDRYAVHRPELVLRWAGGEEVDASGGALPEDAVWQAQLWRAVREELGVPSPAERLQDTVTALRAGLDVPDLPGRLSVFGLTALPVSYLEVLAALAVHRDVHLFLLHPSPALWADIAATRAETVPARGEDPTARVPRNPLLGSWGRDAREMQLVLAAAGDRTEEHLPGRGDAPTTLLARLQAGVRDDRAAPGTPAGDEPDERPPLDPGDRSVQVHACHGRTRQVEVVRDAILHAFADDPTLEPRDVVVMCPDIETYAPIVQAVFDAAATTGDGAGVPDVRVALADRALRQTNPLLRVVADVLDQADGRLTAPDVLDLASRTPVRRRFGFDDEDLARLEEWVSDAQIRWGLHGEHRAAFELAGVEANTWRAGLDRVLLGVTVADAGETLVGGTAPLDVDGGDVDLAGRFAELLDRLDEAVGRLAGPQPVRVWCDALAHTADLLAATGEADRWQRLQLDRLLRELQEEATAPGDDDPSTIPLALPEARGLLAERLRGRPSRANHRTGDLTVCTLVPMRSVPHRVVCLLGMDDGTFPRRTVPDGDDLLDRAPRVGDRDLRTEDRQLLLDALLAAADTLVVTYTGRDERTNEPRPPAVPIGELLDEVDATVRTSDGRAARDHVRVEHPLQAFGPANFTSGHLGRPGPWGFDRVALDGARARAAGTTETPRFLDGPLEGWAPEGPLALDDLVAFLAHPVRAFLRQRLDVTLPRVDEELSDAIPVELDPLDRWGVGERLLAARRAGADEDRWAAVERARGVLPPGALAERELERLRADVEAILQAAADELADLGCDPDLVEGVLPVQVAVPGHRTLVGSVGGVHGHVLVSLAYSRLAPKHRLAAWARLLAATATDPERPWCALTVGRVAGWSKTKLVSVACVKALGDTAEVRRRRACDALAVLVELYERGMREPLPVFCATSAAYAAAAHDGEDPRRARKQWTTQSTGFDREDRDPAHRLVLGGVVPFDEVLAAEPLPEECGEGWFDVEEPSRLGRYARRLWAGLLDAEEVRDR